MKDLRRYHELVEWLEDAEVQEIREVLLFLNRELGFTFHWKETPGKTLLQLLHLPIAQKEALTQGLEEALRFVFPFEIDDHPGVQFYLQ